MAYHWLMQRVFRDRKTGEIIGRAKPKTLRPESAAYQKKTYPSEWEVLDTKYPVPDDPLDATRTQAISWSPEAVQKEFYSKATAGEKK